jgi:serine/threonine protein kinase
MTETCRSTALTDFEPMDKIGEGSFSSVYKVRRIVDSKIYALKKVLR